MPHDKYKTIHQSFSIAKTHFSDIAEQPSANIQNISAEQPVTNIQNISAERMNHDTITRKVQKAFKELHIEISGYCISPRIMQDGNYKHNDHHHTGRRTTKHSSELTFRWGFVLKQDVDFLLSTVTILELAELEEKHKDIIVGIKEAAALIFRKNIHESSQDSHNKYGDGRKYGLWENNYVEIEDRNISHAKIENLSIIQKTCITTMLTTYIKSLKYSLQNGHKMIIKDGTGICKEPLNDLHNRPHPTNEDIKKHIELIKQCMEQNLLLQPSDVEEFGYSH